MFGLEFPCNKQYDRSTNPSGSNNGAGLQRSAETPWDVDRAVWVLTKVLLAESYTDSIAQKRTKTELLDVLQALFMFLLVPLARRLFDRA